MTPGKARALARNYLEEGDPLFEYVLGAMDLNELIPSVWDLPRFNLEKRVVMEECGLTDPGDVDQYLARDGYSGFFKALNASPAETIQEILQSGLRGRGGAGFSTGRKWQLASSAPGRDK